ncbi:MAG: stalk domain-containing protein [Armatimonadota bacterium]
MVWFTLIILLSIALSADPAQWQISVNGADISTTVLDRGGEIPMVNVMSIAPILGITVSILGGNSLQLVDKVGTSWQANHGDITLTSNGKTIPLSVPALIQGTEAYLPAPVIAEISGLYLTVDITKRQLSFTQEEQVNNVKTDSDVPDSSDLQAFTLEKSPQEKARTILSDVVSNNKSPRRLNPLYKPPKDTFLFGVGLGYVQRGNLSMDVIGNGMIGGLKANFGASLINLQSEARLQSVRGSLRDDESGWQVDAGNLSSNLNGGVNGLRYTRRVAADHWPAVMLFTRDTRHGDSQVLLAVQDELRIGSRLRLGGELVSDRAFFLKGQYTTSRWSLSGFHREQPGQNTAASGVYFSRALGNRISLAGGINRSKADGKSQDWRNLSLSLPLMRAVNLILDVSKFTDDTSSSTTYGAMFGIPVGPVQFLMRYQWNSRSQSFSGPNVFPIDTVNRNLNVSAHYAATPRLNFDYQVTSQWSANGNTGSSQRLVSSYQISPRTQLQVVSAFPNFTDPDCLTLRLSQSLNNGYSATLDYGKFVPTQDDGKGTTGFGYKIMLRKSWPMQTAARGGEVSGRVTDLYGKPAPEIEVLLGGYRALTDTDGRYKFTRVPSGAYTVKLDEGSLSAALQADKGLHPLVINNHSREVVDFHVIPLNSILGCVYIDNNSNSQYDVGEGIKLVVLRLNNSATTSDGSGSFGFYNLPPGKHVVRLDVAKLPVDLAPDSPVEVTIQLEENKTVTGLEFRLKKVEKQIDFQTLE